MVSKTMAVRGWPLRSKLALMFVSVCLLTFGVGGYLVSSSAKGALEREILDRLDFQSRAYATALDAYLQMLIRRSQDFASDGFIRDHAEALLEGSDDPARLREELRTHLLQNKLPLEGAFFDLAVIGSEGEVLGATRAALPSALVKHATAGRPSGEPWISELLAARGPNGFPHFAIATTLTSRDRGTRLGELVVWIHPAIWITNALRANGVGQEEAAGEVALRLVDSRGSILHVHDALSDPARPLLSAELLRSGFGLELEANALPFGPPGGAVFTKDFPMSTNGWSARIELHGEDIHSAVAGLQSRFVGLGIVLSLAACVLFLLPMSFLTRPLHHLANAARRLAGGDLTTRVTADTDDELGELALSFNTMAEAIEDRTHRMERTADDLRKRQDELRFERDRLKAVITAMRDGLVVLDAAGEPVFHNRAAGPLLKELRSERSAIAAHHTCSDVDSQETACRTCLFSPTLGSRSCVVEIDGGVFEIHAAKLAPDVHGQSGRVLVSRDLSDSIEQDERQIHQERLAVLGEVAAVMAHELNNPLAAISMYNQMLGQGLDGQSELSENVEVIQRNVESCSRTIRELLDYATNTTPEIGSVDVKATLEDVSTFLRPLRERSNVSLELSLPRDPLEVAGDEIQIRQIFINLIVNAIQAAGSEGGSVRVETGIEDGRAVIDVMDDGEGVPPDVREKIFRPFFTTKDRGQGTGLGLPTARRIAEMHGGGLDLIESGGEGSIFRVRLRLEGVDAA